MIAGNSDESLLIKAVRYTDKELQMPPKARLAPGQVADLEAWVKMGAPDPRTETKAADFHATILHLMGLHHERLTYRHLGRDFRLTDVRGQVVKEIIA